MSFMRPKIKSTPAPPPPVIEDTAGKQQEYEDSLRKRRGRAASTLHSGDSAPPVTASKALLGS